MRNGFRNSGTLCTCELLLEKSWLMSWLLASFLARQLAFSFSVGIHTRVSPLGNHLLSGVLGVALLLMDNYKGTFIGAQKVTLHPAPHLTRPPLALEMHKK